MFKVAELKPPTCEEIKPLIPLLVHEELAPVQRGTVLAHFLHCSQCAEEYHLQLEGAVAVGEVRLPHLKPDAFERARRRMEQSSAGTSVITPSTLTGEGMSEGETFVHETPLWDEIREQTSRWTQEKQEVIVETLQGLALLWQPLQPQPAAITTRGTRGIRTRGGIRGMNTIPAEILNSDLKPSGEETPFEIISEPQFTSDGRFRCELTTEQLHLEGYTLSLTISSEDKPVVAFTAELLKTRGREGKLRATFDEDGFDRISPSLVPIENIKLQVLPM